MVGGERLSASGSSLELAREIFGNDCLGPEEVYVAFGRLDLPEQLPPIPFSPDELQRAKNLNQYLVLRVDQDRHGFSRFTINRHFHRSLPKPEAFSEEKVVREEVPRVGWALVSKRIIPGSANKNYLEQTEIIADYLKNVVFKNQQMPQFYADAILEFEAQRETIREQLADAGRLTEAAGTLAGLSLTHLTRQTAVEALYDRFVYDRVKFERRLRGPLLFDGTWTGTLSKYGDKFFEVGPYFGPYSPNDHWEKRGAVLSRLV